MIEAFLPKLEKWMETSKGKVRADVAHDKLVAMGFTGSERTTRVLSEHGCKIASNTYWVAKKRAPSARSVRNEYLKAR